MKKMGRTGLQWLTIFHLFFVCMWVGGGISLLVIFFLSNPSGGDELYAANMAIKLVDDFVIIPGANGCLLTGLIYGIWTKWGFFRHNWLRVKWVMTVVQIIFGTFWLGPWVNGNAAIAGAARTAALRDPVFLHNQAMNAVWGPIQVSLLLVMVWVSVKKPWKGKKKAQEEG